VGELVVQVVQVPGWLAGMLLLAAWGNVFIRWREHSALREFYDVQAREMLSDTEIAEFSGLAQRQKKRTQRLKRLEAARKRKAAKRAAAREYRETLNRLGGA